MPSLDTSQCSIALIQPSGFYTLSLTLTTLDARINIEASLFGYDIVSSDFEQTNPISATTSNETLIYNRTGDEALLELYDDKGINLIKTFSLAREKTMLDFSDILNGEYLLRIINFKTNQSKSCELILAKD